MANARRGEVDLELGGETFSLVFDFNAISDLEAKFNDRPVNELFSSASGSIPMRVVREALRVGMERRGRKRTSNEVGRMIGEELQKDATALPRIVAALVEGITGAFGKTGEQPEAAKESAPKKEEAEKPRPTVAPEIGGA